MSNSTTPSAATTNARSIGGGLYQLGRTYMMDGACIGANQLQGTGTGGTSHFVAGSIGATDLQSGLTLTGGSLLVDTGTAGAYVLTPSPAFASYAAGQTVAFLATHANTGSTNTINISGLGTKNLYRPGLQPLQAGDIQLNQLVIAEYDGTQFNLLSGVAPGAATPVGWYQGTDSGSANAYVVALAPAATAYVAGMQVDFKAANSNTGASTINVNGLGVVNILQAGGTAPLFPNQIRLGDVVSITYDGTQFQLEDPANDPGTFLVASLGNAYGNSTTANTSLFTGATLVGSTSIPSLAFQVGRLIRVRANGVYGTTNAGVNLTFRIVVGSSVALTTGVSTMPSTATTNGIWAIDVEILTTATGASGGLLSNGFWEFMPPSGSTTKGGLPFTANTSAVAIDTTAARALDIQCTWGTANASNTIQMTNCSVEMLN